jgi:putative DNA primase/helicase
MLDLQDYEIGNHRIACPECGRGGRDKTAGLKVEGGSAVMHCFRCGAVQSYRAERAIVRRGPCIKPRQAQQQHTTLNDWGKSLWGSTQELSGVAVDYLQHRHCQIPPAYGDLRWHPALKHPGGHVGPALVALITDVHTNQALSLHRTWITATGKAEIDTPRMLLGNHATVNGVIRLFPDEEVNHTLGIAEGIETALSLAWFGYPVWAAIDAGHIGKFPVLNGITQLVIAQDNDPAGIAGATECAQRWADADRWVIVTQQQQNDLNDEVSYER